MTPGDLLRAWMGTGFYGHGIGWTAPGLLTQ